MNTQPVTHFRRKRPIDWQNIAVPSLAEGGIGMSSLSIVWRLTTGDWPSPILSAILSVLLFAMVIDSNRRRSAMALRG